MSLWEREKKAARAALQKINPVSIRENVEYGVVIYQTGHTFGATDPFTSRRNDALYEHDIVGSMQSRPKGARVAALCHTHARDEKGTFSALFSPEDIAVARQYGIDAFLATPQGELVMFRFGDGDSFPREPLGP